MTWHPIETAPEGQTILVFDEGYIGKALCEGGRWLDVECREKPLFDPPPTHWMPLPDPPTTDEGGS